MAVTLNDLLDGLRGSRRHFLKHVEGLREEQWDWKPYPECKSIRETLMHLRVDDRAALASIQSGKEPDYEALSAEEAEQDAEKLLSALNESFETLLTEISQRYADAPLDAEICIFGDNKKLAVGVPYLSSEDFYHAGQVAFVRMASDPAWDYYTAIYSGH